MEWTQVYDPLGAVWLSTALAALPVVLLLVTLGILEWKAHWAALTGLGTACAVAVLGYGMPWPVAASTAIYGACSGLFPIGWIVVNAMFLYNLTVHVGQFEIVKSSIAGVSDDRRIQALLIAFAFGGLIEGAAGFGTPVAISSALLLGLGFPPLMAAGLTLMANTAPVAFGAIGTPTLTLATVTGLSATTLSAMTGRQLFIPALIVPFWLVAMMSGWRGLRAVWPAALVAGLVFSCTQLAWSNFVGPELAAVVSGIVTLVALAVFCSSWRPAQQWDFPGAREAGRSVARPAHKPAAVRRAWVPWILLSVIVTTWGLPQTKALLTAGTSGLQSYLATRKTPAPNAVLSPVIPVPNLHHMVYRQFPVVQTPVDPSRIADPAYKQTRAETATFTFNWLSAAGTAILVTTIVSGLFFGVPLGTLIGLFGRTLFRMRYPLLTIATMLSLGYVTRYAGLDATLGLAFTHTGVVYPFFAAVLGWLGVALTGSDTSSNVLFGNLQTITARQLGLSPILLASANSSGGVMGKMIDAQSIVVAGAATGRDGEEGRILRFVFWHSLALAGLMGTIIMLQAYVVPWMIPAP
jgi:lactate permease